MRTPRTHTTREAVLDSTAAVLKWELMAGGKREAGHIVAISSVQGIIGLPARTAYSASKHALHGFFDGLRAGDSCLSTLCVTRAHGRARGFHSCGGHPCCVPSA
jgi:NADP-dependent 3-hydroxy acid dehydrogenase YdfG